jgi:hypothetical protein
MQFNSIGVHSPEKPISLLMNISVLKCPVDALCHAVSPLTPGKLRDVQLTKMKLIRYVKLATKEKAKTVRHAEHPVQLTLMPGAPTTYQRPQ